MVSVPVDDEQGEDHEGEGQQGAHHDQLVPVRLGVEDLPRASLARQDDALLSLNVRCARVTNQSGALLARLRPHTVVGQQLAETLLFGPALVGLLPVGLRHHHQVSLWSGVQELAGRVTVAPPPLRQVGPRLTGQDFESVDWECDELALGATYKYV